jgi:hypothetical protein
MKWKHQIGRALRLGAAIAPLAVAGCMVHHGYGGGAEVRFYDADHRDYHAWNDGEVVYYQRWEADSHREHRDFDRRDRDEQKDYWNWRHSHSE